MIQSYDVGSMPLEGDKTKIIDGATLYDSLSNLLYKRDSGSYFENKVVSGFKDKLEVGIDIPNYPQHRDMNEMFLQLIGGVEKKDRRYSVIGKIIVNTKKATIPEVKAIKMNLRQLKETTGLPIKLKICVTGPYTLLDRFTNRSAEILTDFGNVISSIVEKNVFNEKYGKVEILALDEPLFGVFDDPLIDHGSGGREKLQKAWEKIAYSAKVKGVKTCIHLHNTKDNLFWDIESLDIIEAHINDPIYSTGRTKKLLNQTDKFVKASISSSDFNRLIFNKVVKTMNNESDEIMINNEVSQIWRNIKRELIDSTIFIEEVTVMKARLAGIIDRFGLERVSYAGPECGFKTFPKYKYAVENLRRISEAVNQINIEYK